MTIIAILQCTTLSRNTCFGLVEVSKQIYLCENCVLNWEVGFKKTAIFYDQNLAMLTMTWLYVWITLII